MRTPDSCTKVANGSTFGLAPSNILQWYQWELSTPQRGLHYISWNLLVPQNALTFCSTSSCSPLFLFLPRRIIILTLISAVLFFHFITVHLKPAKNILCGILKYRNPRPGEVGAGRSLPEKVPLICLFYEYFPHHSYSTGGTKARVVYALRALLCVLCTLYIAKVRSIRPRGKKNAIKYDPSVVGALLPVTVKEYYNNKTAHMQKGFAVVLTASCWGYL